MLSKDLAAGFSIAGSLRRLCPVSLWETLFLTHSASWIQVPANAVIGVAIAVLSFVCSIEQCAVI